MLEDHCGRYHCEAVVEGTKVISRDVTVSRLYQVPQSDGVLPTTTNEGVRGSLIQVWSHL